MYDQSSVSSIVRIQHCLALRSFVNLVYVRILRCERFKPACCFEWIMVRVAYVRSQLFLGLAERFVYNVTGPWVRYLSLNGYVCHVMSGVVDLRFDTASCSGGQ